MQTDFTETNQTIRILLFLCIYWSSLILSYILTCSDSFSTAEDTTDNATVQIQLHHAIVFLLLNALTTVIPGSCN